MGKTLASPRGGQGFESRRVSIRGGHGLVFGSGFIDSAYYNGQRPGHPGEPTCEQTRYEVEEFNLLRTPMVPQGTFHAPMVPLGTSHTPHHERDILHTPPTDMLLPSYAQDVVDGSFIRPICGMDASYAQDMVDGSFIRPICGLDASYAQDMEDGSFIRPVCELDASYTQDMEDGCFIRPT
ncbi:hypothetical protein LXL04_034297 [Taraxacum kok-saghyz]